jgi:hypothetical protein
MGLPRAPHIRYPSGRGEPELGGVGLGDNLGQHGRNPTHCQPDHTPCGLLLEPMLGGPPPNRHWDVDNPRVDDEDQVAGITLFTSTGTICGDLLPTPPSRCPSRRAVDVPHSTMVSFTKDVEYPSNIYILTRAGEESAHVYLAVLLLRESFDSVQRRRVPGMRLCTLLEVHPHESATKVNTTSAHSTTLTSNRCLMLKCPPLFNTFGEQKFLICIADVFIHRVIFLSMRLGSGYISL